MLTTSDCCDFARLHIARPLQSSTASTATIPRPGRTAASRWKSGRGGTALRVVDPRPGRPVDPRRLRWPAADPHLSARAWAPTAQPTSPSRRADLFPQALCLSGNYDPTTWHGWGEQRRCLYFQNPTAYVANLEGDHLAWLRHQRPPQLVCGQGMWEDTHRRAGQHPGARGPARAEGHPARAGRLGPRRRPRLAVVASPTRAPPVPHGVSGACGANRRH